jgi:hypothetical protein
MPDGTTRGQIVRVRDTLLLRLMTCRPAERDFLPILTTRFCGKYKPAKGGTQYGSA